MSYRFVALQDLGELLEAKQLLIQQKVELQGQVEAAQKSLEQEQKEHQATRDSRSQREEQLCAQTKIVQDQLVCSLAKFHQMILNRWIKYHSLLLIPSHDTINASFQSRPRSEREKSR